MRHRDPSLRTTGLPGRRAWEFLLAPALLAGAAATAGAQSKTYTTDADFDLGILVDVNHDFPNNDQLQLDVVDLPFPFLCVPASGRGTIVRIHAETGEVLGEYQSAPEGLATDPSRTTIDSLGNCWAGNRARDILGLAGSVVKIGVVVGGTRVNANGTPDPNGGYLAPPFDYSTCVDRDGDGLIRTSMGLGDVLAWPDITDGNGGMGGPALVEDAFDECILIYQRTDCSNIRHVSIDANNDVWVGGYPSFQPNCFQFLSGVDGSIMQTFPTVNFCGGFTGIVDGAGVVWSSSRNQDQLMRYDPALGGNPACVAAGLNPSGVAEDSSGAIWVASTNQLLRFDPAGNLLNTHTIAGSAGLVGVVVTPADDHVWAASFDTDQVYRVNQSGTVVAVIPTHETPNGVSVDANGRVWVVNLEDEDVQRIDPATNQIDLTVSLGAGSLPFSPSHMTGAVGFPATVPVGEWTVVFDGGAPDIEWETVSWTSAEPNASLIEVFVRSADNAADLPNLPYMQVQNGVDFSSMGRFIEIQARFARAPMGNESPILFDLTVEGTEGPPPPEDCIDYNHRNPGSLLLYPEFDNRSGIVSVLTVTDVDCLGEEVDVEFIYRDKRDCEEFNRTERLTPCDTLTLITNFHDPNDEQGYVYAFAKSTVTGEPVVHDSLIGNLLIVNGLDSFEYSVNPVVFRGIGDGSVTNLDGDDIRDLDGIEYEMAPDEILVPRFLGQAALPGGGFGATSELVLIGLTGGQEFTTRLDFLIYNDNEETFSSEYEFFCWDKPRLLDISGVFANTFLRDWTNDDRDEILGASHLESGWMRIDGAVASSAATSIEDPAFYAVLVERIGSYATADLPFELCSQDNGDLLPTGLLGDE